MSDGEFRGVVVLMICTGVTFGLWQRDLFAGGWMAFAVLIVIGCVRDISGKPDAH